MFFVDPKGRVQVAVVSGRKAQHERSHDEDDDAQFLTSQHNFLPERDQT